MGQGAALQGAQRGQDRRIVAVAEGVVEAGGGDVLREAHPFEREQRRRRESGRERTRPDGTRGEAATWGLVIYK